MATITLKEALSITSDGAPNGWFFRKNGEIWVAVDDSNSEESNKEQ